MIKVSAKIKPIHFEKRTACELIIGKEYYVSWGSNEAYKCTLTEIHEVNGRPRISVEVKPPEPIRYQGGYYLYPDEIGETPEQAVLHEVTL